LGAEQAPIATRSSRAVSAASGRRRAVKGVGRSMKVSLT
jgi:hypothetical protein